MLKVTNLIKKIKIKLNLKLKHNSRKSYYISLCGYNIPLRGIIQMLNCLNGHKKYKNNFIFTSMLETSAKLLFLY